MEVNQLSTSTTCKHCSYPVLDTDYFCPSCGKKIKDKPVSFGVWSLLWLFVLSLFLPPLGIGLTIRYIKSEDERARILGWISLVVTLVALIVTVLIAKSFMDSLTQQINSQMENLSL